MRAVFFLPGSTSSPARRARHSFMCQGIIKGFTCLTGVCVCVALLSLSLLEHIKSLLSKPTKLAHSAGRVTCVSDSLSDLSRVSCRAKAQHPRFCMCLHDFSFFFCVFYFKITLKCNVYVHTLYSQIVCHSVFSFLLTKLNKIQIIRCVVFSIFFYFFTTMGKTGVLKEWKERRKVCQWVISDMKFEQYKQIVRPTKTFDNGESKEPRRISLSVLPFRGCQHIQTTWSTA